MKKRIIYREILMELSLYKTPRLKLKYISSKESCSGAEKKIYAAIKHRILAVSSVNSKEKISEYGKSASYFDILSGIKGFGFFKALYYENKAFYFVVKASTSNLVISRLKNYKQAFKLFRNGFLLAKKYGLTESQYLCRGWFHLTKALYYENLFYQKPNFRTIKLIFINAKSARNHFNKLKVKKLVELSSSLVYYATALEYKQEYNKTGREAIKNSFRSLMQKAAGCITCNEFADIKMFYLNCINDSW
jgi:hypothetical protein